MKKSVFTLFLLALIAFGSNAQTIRRCNNDPNVPLGLNMYRTLQAAHDAAVANDIIYVEPSYLQAGNNLLSYGTLTCTKTLRIIGNGHLQQYNLTITQPWEQRESMVENINIASGVGTILQSLSFVGSSSITVKAQNVTVTRCQLGSGGAISLIRTSTSSEDASGTTISQNVFYNFPGNINITGTYTSASCNYTALQVQNVVIKNNINLGSINANTVYTGTCPNLPTTIPGANNLIISNNTGIGNISQCQNCTVHSNIFINTSTAGILNTCPGTSAAFNVCGTNPCVNGTNNVNSAVVSTIFIGGSSLNLDKSYQLSATSPAIGAGFGGVDAGAFGTNNPYRLSGLAPVPQITAYSQNASSGIYTTATPMSITISVRGNN